MSSVNIKWDTIIVVPAVLRTQSLKNWPAVAATSNILLNGSITTSNISEDKGSPCRISLELPKKSEGLPLIKMENLTVEMQHTIHFLHFSENVQRWGIYIRKPQFTWSYAFSTSNLHNTPGVSVFSLLSIHSAAMFRERKRRYRFGVFYSLAEIIPKLFSHETGCLFCQNIFPPPPKQRKPWKKSLKSTKDVKMTVSLMQDKPELCNQKK